MPPLIPIQIITMPVEKLSQILLLGQGEKLVTKTIETESVVDRAIITKTNNCLKMLLVDRWLAQPCSSGLSKFLEFGNRIISVIMSETK